MWNRQKLIWLIDVERTVRMIKDCELAWIGPASCGSTAAVGR